MARDRSLRVKSLTKKLIQGIEEGSVNFNKAPEVLSFLKAGGGMLSPGFIDIWLDKSVDGDACFNLNGAFLPYIKNDALDLAELFIETFLFAVGSAPPPLGAVRVGSNYKKIVVDGFASKQGLLCKPPQMINFRSRSNLVDNASLTRYPAALRRGGSFHVMLNDNYDKKFVNFFENDMREDTYGYTDGAFDVSVKAGDTVIDAGSLIGDFAAYAAARGAYTYAFEPVEESFNLLKKTAKLNNDKIFPVKKGLGNIDGEVKMFIDDKNPGGCSIKITQGDIGGGLNKECMISITTLDKFAADNGLKKIDFIKADIEGAERDMLRGAKTVLKEFAPKLAICTYHLPDDPKVLESLILEANPRYKVRQGPKKLYAAVV